MKLRTLVLGVVACGLVVVWRWTANGSAEPERLPVATPRRDARLLTEVARMVRVDRAEQLVEPVETEQAAPEAIPDPESPEPEAEISVEERRAQRLIAIADRLDGHHGAIVGRVRDQA